MTQTKNARPGSNFPAKPLGADDISPSHNPPVLAPSSPPFRFVTLTRGVLSGSNNRIPSGDCACVQQAHPISIKTIFFFFSPAISRAGVIAPGSNLEKWPFSFADNQSCYQRSSVDSPTTSLPPASWHYFLSLISVSPRLPASF